MIKPIGNLILAKKEKRESGTTKSGILLTNQTEEEVETYIIIELGESVDQKSKLQTILKEKQTIIVDEFEAKKIVYEGNEYVIIIEENILGVIELKEEENV